MKILRVETLIERGPFAQSGEWRKIRKGVLAAVKSVDWPVGSGSFTIYPESGKKRGKGNGVKPIKNVAIKRLKTLGWKPECCWPVGERKKHGNIDAIYESSAGLIGFEWETGNISSSHRALNKLCLGLVTKAAVGGFLVVPSRKLYKWLTDRIGNIDELAPYFPLWSAIPCKQGILEIIVIEHDAESLKVPRIPKGTDGRAKN
jgi:hypothetical protein